MIYIPPSISADLFLQFFSVFEHCTMNINNHVVVMGDFNVSHFIDDDLNNPKVLAVTNFLNITGLLQYNNILNHNGRLLDLLFSDMICRVVHDDKPLVIEDTHHPALSIEVEVGALHTNQFPFNQLSNCYNLKKPIYMHCMIQLCFKIGRF